MRHKLVLYQNDCFQVLEETQTTYLLKFPYRKKSEKILVQKADCKEYPRTFDDIVKRWIPDVDPLEGWVPHLYILEVIAGVFHPKFLLAPKEIGFYQAMWLEDDNEVKTAFLMFWPRHKILSDEQIEGGYNTFDVMNLSWRRMEDLILLPRYKNIRFIPWNPGIAYTYFLHLIEAEVMTPEQVQEAWGKKFK